MRRRDFFRFLGAITLSTTFPVVGKAELPLVVWFSFSDEATAKQYFKAVEDGLRKLGLIDGKTIRFRSYFAGFSKQRMNELVPQIIEQNPAACILHGAVIKPMAAATKTIPLVTGSSGDMVAGRLVASLSHPGGNITGIQFMAIDLVAKRLELLKEIYPSIKRVAVIADPGHAGELNEREKTLSVAATLGIQVDYKPVTNPQELQSVLDALSDSDVEAIVAFPDAITFGPRKKIADFALKQKLPAVSGWDAYADSGFLFVYGPSLTAAWDRMAYFVDRILKGARPEDLPAELPSVIELIINLKTAKALGIEVPQNIVFRANRVIE